MEAVLAEQHDDWAERRRYLGLDVLAGSRVALINTDEKEVLTPAARHCLECFYRITW